MRKLSLSILVTGLALVGSVAMGSCNGSEEKTNDNEALEFANRFAEFVQNGQLDSIKAYYPDATLGDSLIAMADSTATAPGKITLDNIKANEAADTFQVTTDFMGAFTLVRDADGSFKVAATRGLMHWPEDQRKLAQKLGQFDLALTDAENAGRMADTEFRAILVKAFADYLNNNVYSDKEWAFQGDAYVEDSNTYATIVVHNKTNKAIAGSDYHLQYKLMTHYFGGGVGSETMTAAGKEIPASGSVTFSEDYGFQYCPSGGAKIVWKLTPEQLFDKYYTPTGKEYTTKQLSL